MNRIYLDNNASTVIDPFVLEKVIKALQENTGNPSSVHYDGQYSRKKLNEARETISSFLGVKANEIIFTSGGTEGAAILLNGFFRAYGTGHIISSEAEHSCVYNAVQQLHKAGCQVSYLPTGLWGAVRVEQVEEALRSDTRLIVLMAVNNETGVKTDVESIAELANQRGIPFFVDGVALMGKEKFTIPRGVSGMFFSGHKFHAPKGVGALFIKSSLKIEPLFYGGPQEKNRRAGTENLPGIVGMAAATQLLKENQSEYTQYLLQIRDRFEQGIIERLPDVKVNGLGPRICNTSNLSFLGVNGESLLLLLDSEISVSHGSACSSGSVEPSRPLLKMGIPLHEARSALRFSFSRFNTIEEIDRAIDKICQAVTQLRTC